MGLGEDGLTGPLAPLGHWACAESPAPAQKRRGVGGVGGAWARAGGWETERQVRRERARRSAWKSRGGKAFAFKLAIYGTTFVEPV